jgi:hypothetical protein
MKKQNVNNCNLLVYNSLKPNLNYIKKRLAPNSQ